MNSPKLKTESNEDHRTVTFSPVNATEMSLWLWVITHHARTVDHLINLSLKRFHRVVSRFNFRDEITLKIIAIHSRAGLRMACSRLSMPEHAPADP
jgi:hypothetical protein